MYCELKIRNVAEEESTGFNRALCIVNIGVDPNLVRLLQVLIEHYVL